jgi:predicted secreted hydrolase
LLIDVFLTFFGAHPFLFTNIFSLGFCLGVASSIRPAGRMVLMGGLMNLPCFYLITLLEGNYWTPVRLGNWAVGIEDALCSFDVGALVLIPAVVLFRNSIIWENWNSRALGRFLFGGGAASALFLLLIPFGLSPMSALVGTCSLMALGLFIIRLRLWPLGMSGLFGFTVLYTLIVKAYFLLWPDFIKQWNPEGPWGVVLLGLPAGEIAWAVAFGAFWPLFVGFVFNIQLAPVAQGLKGALPNEPGAIRRQNEKTGEWRLGEYEKVQLSMPGSTAPLASSSKPKIKESPLEMKTWPFFFPRDHGSHPKFETEWWYLSGNLTTFSGVEWGYQFVVFRHRPMLKMGPLFRFKVPADGFASQLVITHCEEKKFSFQERYGSHLLGTAGARPDELDVRVRGWSIRAKGERLRLLAQEKLCGLHLDLLPQKAPVLNGHRGFSLKVSSPEGSSHHYSVTSIDTQGTITWDGQAYPVRGKSWLDREFGTQIFPSVVQGWDWFSLRLDNGFELMLVIVRSCTTGPWAAGYGTLIGPDGNSVSLKEEDFGVRVTGSWKSPSTSVHYPMGWVITLPARQMQFEVVPIMEDHEINSAPFWKIHYWEGPASINGTMMGTWVKGRGYVELTGYAESIGGRF